MAQRIRHLTTNQGIPGSNPGRVIFNFFSFIVTDLVVTLLFEHASLTAMLPKGIRHLTTKEGMPASSPDGFAVTLFNSLLPILVVKLVFEHSNLTALWPNG